LPSEGLSSITYIKGLIELIRSDDGMKARHPPFTRLRISLKTFHNTTVDKLIYISINIREEDTGRVT
jgi:hypothetical protein